MKGNSDLGEASCFKALLELRKDYRVQKKQECLPCDGTGSIIIDNPEISYPTTGTCPKCKGAGYTWQTVEVK